MEEVLGELYVYQVIRSGLNSKDCGEERSDVYACSVAGANVVFGLSGSRSAWSRGEGQSFRHCMSMLGHGIRPR